MKSPERRNALRETLITLAERSIERHGLAGVKARDLAAEAGCSLGAIYNAVADLDELVLTVNERTLAAVEALLARPGHAEPSDDPAEAARQLVRLAQAYLHYAARNPHRWRALFDHRLPEGKALPDWYLDRQRRLFGFVEEPLRVLGQSLPPEAAALFARTLFSAVHGIVLLGLEEKIGSVSVSELEEQIALTITALCQGLAHPGIWDAARAT